MGTPQKRLRMKVVSERIEEDPEVSALVTRLEAEADRELAARRSEADPAPDCESTGSRA